MKGFFARVAKVLAAIFAVFFVITAVLAVGLFNLNWRLFDPRLYKNALNEAQVYDKLPALVGRLVVTSAAYNPCADNPILCEDISPELRACYEEALGSDRYAALASSQDKPNTAEQQQIQACFDRFGAQTQPGESGMPAYLQNLSEEDWQAVMLILVPPDEMKLMAESVLDGTFAYLKGDVDQVTVSLVALKKRLAGPAGQDLILAFVKSQPPCTLEDLARLTGLVAGDEIVLCSPPEELLSVILPLLQAELEDVAKGIPDEAVVIEPYAPQPVASDGPLGSNPVAAIRILRLTLGLTPLMPLLCLIGVALFGVRSLRGWMRWWGIPLSIAGIIALALGTISTPILVTLWDAFLVPRLPAFLAAEAGALTRELARYLARSLSQTVIIQALLLTLLGLAAWIGSAFIGRKTAPEKIAPTA